MATQTWATFTFENIVINGVDTSKTYTLTKIPLSGITRIICNGTDRLHKNIDTNLPYSEPTRVDKTLFTNSYAEKVLDNVFYGDYGIAVYYYYNTTYTKVIGFDLTFEVPASVSIDIEEDDDVAGGWVAYDTLNWNNITTLSVMADETTNSITFTSDKETKTYTKSPFGYDLGVNAFNLTVKGRVY